MKMGELLSRDYIRNINNYHAEQIRNLRKKKHSEDPETLHLRVDEQIQAALKDVGLLGVAHEFKEAEKWYG